MPVPPSQTRWKKDNITHVSLDITKNQDPELFHIFASVTGSKGTIAREILRKALAAGLLDEYKKKEE